MTYKDIVRFGGKYTFTSLFLKSKSKSTYSTEQINNLILSLCHPDLDQYEINKLLPKQHRKNNTILPHVCTFDMRNSSVIYTHSLASIPSQGYADVTKFTFAIDDIFGQKHLSATYGQTPKRPHENDTKKACAFLIIIVRP